MRHERSRAGVGRNGDRYRVSEVEDTKFGCDLKWADEEGSELD